MEKMTAEMVPMNCPKTVHRAMPKLILHARINVVYLNNGYATSPTIVGMAATKRNLFVNTNTENVRNLNSSAEMVNVSRPGGVVTMKMTVEIIVMKWIVADLNVKMEHSNVNLVTV